MKYIMAIIILLIVCSSAYADCTYNGTSYPTGTILGPLVCTADGTWRQR